MTVFLLWFSVHVGSVGGTAFGVINQNIVVPGIVSEAECQRLGAVLLEGTSTKVHCEPYQIGVKKWERY